MDEVHAGPGAFGHAGDVPEGQVFHRLGVNQIGVVPVPLAPLLGHKVVVHNQLIVLAVDRQHTTVAGHLLHQVVEPASLQTSARGEGAAFVAGGTDVGSEDLYAGEPCRNQLAEAGDGVGSVGIAVNDVSGVIGVRLALPDRHEVVDSLGQVAFVVHGGEVDYRGGAAPDGAQRVDGGSGVGGSGDQLP